ncbi:hypothetical protein [Chachezhania sediminis]|uniref:hypothetical protein n=1 Tax=Chachezhania sediminis TaxID=2599291 RepID=UPI001E34E826|nr:hypothetical protein [Chachezhania sediminis]
MAKSIQLELIEKILASITLSMGRDGIYSYFKTGSPRSRWSERACSAVIYYHPVQLNLAALYLRSNGPTYLKALPLIEVKKKIFDFVADSFWVVEAVLDETEVNRPFDSLISHEKKVELAAELSRSPLFRPPNEFSYFPLGTIKVEQALLLEGFFFSSSAAEDAFQLKDNPRRAKLNPKNFPPVLDEKPSTWHPISWLGVFSPDYRSALKARSAILAAVALTQPHYCRYMFSLRTVYGGRCTISERGITYSVINERPHTPPCAYDINLSEDDLGWLALLAEKFNSSAGAVRRELKALEYFYRAWALTPEERFPVLCMAIDAIFGDPENATQSVVDGVRATLGGEIDEGRLRKILKLRASVIHGGAPDVYDSSKYPKYFSRYGFDPIEDLELIVAECIKARIFGGALHEHPDPNEEAIKKARDTGRLPPETNRLSILGPVR